MVKRNEAEKVGVMISNCGAGGVMSECWMDLSRTGVNFVRKPTWEQGRRVLRMLRTVDEMYSVALGDVVVQLMEQFGEKEVSKELEQLGFDAVVVGKALDVASVPRGLRNARLDSEHYFVVSKLDNEGKAFWLDLAVKERLSAFELKKSIAAGHVVRAAELKVLSGSNSGGVRSIQGLLVSFERWSKQVGGEESIMSWPKERREQWLREIQPVEELARKVRESIEAGESMAG